MKNFLFLALIFLASASQAARQYGEAGCGLGSMVMGKSGNQVLASTTNNTSYTNTFGITSGTSNCTEDGAVAAHRQLPVYIEANKVALATDSARGSGETLMALSHLTGCPSAPLANFMQKNYGKIFVDMSSSGIQQRLSGSIHADVQMARSCDKI